MIERKNMIKASEKDRYKSPTSNLLNSFTVGIAILFSFLTTRE